MHAERTQKDVASVHVDLHHHFQALWLLQGNASIVSIIGWGQYTAPFDIICVAYQGFTITLQQDQCPMKPARRAGSLLGKISFRLIRPKPCNACSLPVHAHQKTECAGPPLHGSAEFS
jgi:hypothetical protein